MDCNAYGGIENDVEEEYRVEERESCKETSRHLREDLSESVRKWHIGHYLEQVH